MTVPHVTSLIPPQNQEMECAVLGAVLVGDGSAELVAELAGNERLRPESFYRRRHTTIFRAMLALVDRGEPVDVATVCEQLASSGELEEAGDLAYVHSLPNIVPSAGNVRHYAKVVVEYSEARETIIAAREIIDAVLVGDKDAQADAERRLTHRRTGRKTKTRAQRTEQLMEYVTAGEATRWRWPFRQLNDMTGGLWPGHFTVLIGPSTHGKSVLADQILEHCDKLGARCGAYLTEMSEMERDMRYVSGRADVPFRLIRDAKVPVEAMPELGKWAQRLPFDMEPVGTRDAMDLARDIRRQGWDVCLIDLLNVVTGRETKDIDANVGMLASLANETGTHIIGCQHLNRGRFGTDGYPPEPAVGDIRGSGAIHDLSTNVLSVYRRQGTHPDGGFTGEPGDDAVIRFLKLKNGSVGAMQAVFRGNRMRFEPPADPGTVGSVAA